MLDDWYRVGALLKCLIDCALIISIDSSPFMGINMGVSHLAWSTGLRMPCLINLSSSKSILGVNANGILRCFIRMGPMLGSKLNNIGLRTYLLNSGLKTTWNSWIRSSTVALVMVLMPVTPSPRALNQSSPSRFVDNH